MTLHYTVNTFSAAKDIVDVTQVGASDVFSPMGLPICIPDGVSIRGKPKTLDELLQAKATGILEAYSGYTEIVHNPCLSLTGTSAYPGANLTTSYGYISGSGCAHHVLPRQYSALRYESFMLNGNAPSSCVVLWDLYSINSVDAGGYYLRRYTQRAPGDVQCSISFDNGYNTFNNVWSGSVLNILDPGQRGTDMIITFTNNSTTPVCLGSWSVVYGTAPDPNEAP